MQCLIDPDSNDSEWIYDEIMEMINAGDVEKGDVVHVNHDDSLTVRTHPSPAVAYNIWIPFDTNNPKNNHIKKRNIQKRLAEAINTAFGYEE